MKPRAIPATWPVIALASLLLVVGALTISGGGPAAGASSLSTDMDVAVSAHLLPEEAESRALHRAAENEAAADDNSGDIHDRLPSCVYQELFDHPDIAAAPCDEPSQEFRQRMICRILSDWDLDADIDCDFSDEETNGHPDGWPPPAFPTFPPFPTFPAFPTYPPSPTPVPGAPDSSSSDKEETFRLCGESEPRIEEEIARLISGQNFSARLRSQSDGCADLTISVRPGPAGSGSGTQSTTLSVSANRGQGGPARTVSIQIVTEGGVTRVSIGGS